VILFFAQICVVPSFAVQIWCFAYFLHHSQTRIRAGWPRWCWKGKHSPFVLSICACMPSMQLNFIFLMLGFGTNWCALLRSLFWLVWSRWLPEDLLGRCVLGSHGNICVTRPFLHGRWCCACFCVLVYMFIAVHDCLFMSYVIFNWAQVVGQWYLILHN
jgi:hypothetical protein